MGRHCSIFAPVLDYAGVVDVLRDFGSELKIQGGPTFWRAITVRNSTSHLHLAAARIGQAGYDLRQNLNGALGFFSRINTPAKDQKQRVIDLLRNTRMVIGVAAEPELDDDSLEQLSAITQKLGGMIFNGAGMLDAEGRTVLDSEGTSQTSAIAPAPEEDSPDEEEAPAASLNPPEPRRVAARAMCLVAVTYRGMLELQHDKLVAERMRRRVCRWLEGLGLWDELEPWEQHLIYSRVGHVEREHAMSASWRTEALGVLCWSLDLAERPPYDELVTPHPMWNALGILTRESSDILKTACVRSPEQLNDYAGEQLAVHWRLREWSLQKTPIDLLRFARTTEFGRSFRLEHVRLLNNDLTLENRQLPMVQRPLLDRVMAATQQRHQAINWLLGWDKTLSHVDTPT